MFRDGIRYLRDVFNFVDMMQFALNIYLIHDIVNHDKNSGEPVNKTTRLLVTLAVFLMWIKAFYWMRLFGSTSFYIKLIRETLYDIRYFLILFIAILMSFGNCLLIMNEGREEDAIIVT